MDSRKTLVRVIFLVLLCAALSCAQTVNGVISGRVVDPGGLTIPGATVTVTREGTGESRQAKTPDTGDFVFTGMLPGTYSISVQAPGMKRLQEKSVTLTASERLEVGNLQLQLGTQSDTVTVTAEATPVQTGSAERSAVLTNTQIESLNTRARQYLDLLKVLPGVAYDVPSGLGSQDMLGITQGPKVQGLRGEYNTFQTDGLFMNDLGTKDTLYNPTNMDSVTEVKVLLNNYQAEYGHAGGAIINAVTKSGTRDFHGTGYIYKRHEELNANSFFNNLNAVPKPLYRYTTGGGSIGGPLYWPGRLNRNRDKLFFFYSNETLRGDAPQPLVQVSVPTALERTGNFSQSLDQNGKLIVIKDPTNGQPFTNNIIPQSRIDANGQKILNIFPSSNQLNTSITKGAYNYNFQESIFSPKQHNLFRVDLVATNNIRMYFRGAIWNETNFGARLGGGEPTPAWGFLPVAAHYNDNSGVLSFTHTLSPTLVHEASIAAHHATEASPPQSQAELNSVRRSTLGINLPQFYPQFNQYGVVPWALFGGVPNAANIQTDARFPKRGADTVFAFNDSWSKIWGTHTFKAGFYGERIREYEGEQGTDFGQFDFSRDPNNPLDSNYAYSNAILGNFDSYSESTARIGDQRRGASFEFYVQDNWKVTKKLTLDYGVRLSHFIPDWSNDGLAWNFNPAQYNPAQKVALFQPFVAGGTRVALNPLTGATLPAVYIGAIVPSSGSLTNGEVAEFGSNNKIGKTFQNIAPVQYGPRLGIAYDPFGDGKTAIRAGGGIFYNNRARPGALNRNPPSEATPFLYYSSLSTYSSSTSILFPSALTAISGTGEVPSVYSYSLDFQREIGFQTVLDVAYVGNVGRHLQIDQNINTLPYGSRFLAGNVDTTTGKPLQDNFLRPYTGFGDITFVQNATTSNYNSLQVQANHRFTRGLQFGASWTWSKAMDYADTDEGNSAFVSDFLPLRVWNYGKAGFDHTHIFVLNWVYQLPKASKLVDNRVVRFAFDGWQLSNISTFQSGSPYGITLTTVDNADITGGGYAPADAARVIVLSNPAISKSAQTVARFFNPTVFARPAAGTVGNAPKDVVRGPGINNWDTSVFKDLPIKERVRFSFRWEFYNTFNHTQFFAMDTTARFDASGNQANARFGALISNRDPRRMQGSLRVTF